MGDLIDNQGFRHNVGIILCNRERQLLLAGRAGRDGWQFPQGGIRPDESPEEAMYRELREEVGLTRDDVELVARAGDWRHYRLPRRYQRRNSAPLCVGQKQLWFLLRLLARDDAVTVNTGTSPEFDRWRWVEYWEPVHEVIYFKREVYVDVLEELCAVLFPEGPPPRPARPERGRRRGP